MTEKRFIYCFEGIEDKWETVEEYKYTPCTKDGFQDLCVMLNDLNDENEQLKKILGFLRNDNATDILNVLNSQENQIWKLKKENEELKSEIQKLKNVSTK